MACRTDRAAEALTALAAIATTVVLWVVPGTAQADMLTPSGLHPTLEPVAATFDGQWTPSGAVAQRSQRWVDSCSTATLIWPNKA
jgi:hypothetical protein